MESWLSPLYDAEGMRAVDRWAIEEQGIPSPAADGGGRRRRWPRRSPGWRRRGRCGSSAARATTAATGRSRPGSCGGWASRSRRSTSGPARCRPTSTPGCRRRRGRRRDLRHRLRGRAAGAGGGGDRGDQPLRGAGRRLRHRLRRRRLQRRGRGRRGRGRPHRQLPRRQARPADRARQVAHAVSCGSCRSGSRPGPPASRPAGRSTPAVLALAPRRGPRSTKFSSGQVAIAGGSRGLTGAVRMSSLAAIRAGAGYATVAVPADLEPVFEAGEPEVMSVGCPGGDGCLAPASAKALLRSLRARRRRRARARARPRPRLGRAGARGRGRDRGAAGDRRRRAQRLRRRARADRRPRRRRRSSPRTPASWAACSAATPEEIDAHRLAVAREAAARDGRGRRAQGRRHDRHRRRAGRGQRALGARHWPPPAPATSSRG